MTTSQGSWYVIAKIFWAGEDGAIEERSVWLRQCDGLWVVSCFVFIQ